MTNFFSQLKAIAPDAIIKLSISTIGETLSLSLMLDYSAIGEQSLNQIIPLTIKGSPEEIDQSFFSAIAQPLTQTIQTANNIQAYLKSIEEAKVKSKIEQAQKSESQSKKKLWEEFVAKIEALEKDMNYTEALELISQCTAHEDKATELTKMKNNLMFKSTQISLL